MERGNTRKVFHGFYFAMVFICQVFYVLTFGRIAVVLSRFICQLLRFQGCHTGNISCILVRDLKKDIGCEKEV